MDRESCIFALPYRNITFRAIFVKPQIIKEVTSKVNIISNLRLVVEPVNQQLNANFELRYNLLRKRGRPCKELANFAINYKHFLQLDDVKQFVES